MAKWTLGKDGQLRRDGALIHFEQGEAEKLIERIVALLNAAEPGGLIDEARISAEEWAESNGPAHSTEDVDGWRKLCPQDAARAYEKPNEILATGHKVDRQT